jgi:class 3 adenylate cyclase
MKKLFDFILKKYKTANLEIQKRSKVLLVFLLVALLFGIFLMLFEMIQGFPFSTYMPFLFGIPVALIILTFLKIGSYNIASLMFISIFIIMNSMMVIADPYDIPFELYRYTFSMMFALITACLVAYRRWQVLMVGIVGNIGLILLFLNKYLSGKFTLDKITITTFINAFILYALSGIFGYLVMSIQKQLVNEAEENLNKAESTLKESERRLRITEVYTKHSIVDSISRGKDPTKDSPVRKNLAILFCDIKNFTSISEVIKADDVVKMLNIYYKNMNNAIISKSGEIDKLVGDSIMAVFNEADNALIAGIKMKKALNNPELLNFSKFKIDNGIGIHYGSVIVGNIGSIDKMDNTVIGDVVNSASRLEDLTRVYGADIIISEKLKNNLKEFYLIRFIDEAILKGKKKKESYYEVYDFKSNEEKEWVLNNIKNYEEAYRYYRDGDFDEALNAYSAILKNSKFDRPLLSFYIERLKNLKDKKISGQLKDWNGIYQF